MPSTVVKASPDELLVRAKARILSDVSTDVDIESPSHARIDIYPHQLDAAIFALNSRNRRALLADEVGLGKTIEAGLIMKELVLKGECDRAIIITPASLVSQWETELRSKFSLDVYRIESQDTAMLKGNDPGIFLMSVDLAKRRLDLFSALTWDLALFDEAHHLRQHQVGEKGRRATLKYKLGKVVADRSKALIMLTATPMQLNYFEFYSLTELLDPNLFRDYETFTRYAEYVISDLRNALNHLENPDEDSIARARELIITLDRMFPGVLAHQADLDGTTNQQIVDTLHQFDFIARIMIRHRKREEFPNLKPRTVQTYPVQYTDDEIDVYQQVSTFIRKAYAQAEEEGDRGKAFLLVTYQQLLSSSRRALLSTLNKRYKLLTEGPVKRHDSKEQENDELIEDVDISTLEVPTFEGEMDTALGFIRDLSNLKVDSKLNSLKTLIGQYLNEHPEEKVIIFTRFIETQRYIQEALVREFVVSSFNGEMSLEEKDLAIEKFRKEAQVLISTEAGGEGRNLQFCHIIINYDLPWNPVRLEQRIGRIDRIGQEKAVIVTNLASYDTIEQRIMDSLSTRIAAFVNLVGPVDPILGSIESDIEEIFMKREELSELDKEFEDRLSAKLGDSEKAHSNLANLISHSPRSRARMQHLVGELRQIQDGDMERFIFDALRLIPGAKIVMIEPHTYSIRLGLFSRYYASEEPAWTGTTFRRIAVENTVIDFFTRDHPLFKAILDQFRLSDGLTIASQVEQGEKPSLILGLELVNANTNQRKIVCIHYDSNPTVITPRNFFSLSSKNPNDSWEPGQLLDSQQFKDAVISSRHRATGHAGAPWRFGEVRFLLVTNPSQWGK